MKENLHTNDFRFVNDGNISLHKCTTLNSKSEFRDIYKLLEFLFSSKAKVHLKIFMII